MKSFKIRNIKPREVIADGVRIRNLVNPQFVEFVEKIFEAENMSVRFVSLAIIIESKTPKKQTGEKPEVSEEMKVTLLLLRHENPEGEESGRVLIESDNEEVLNIFLAAMKSE